MKIVSMILSFIACFQIAYFFYLYKKEKESIENYIMPDFYAEEDDVESAKLKQGKGLVNSIKIILGGVNKQIFKKWNLKKRIDTKLSGLGHNSHIRAEDVLIFKEIAAVGGIFISYFILHKQMNVNNPLMLVGFAVLIFFIPDFILSKKAKERAEAIRISLPAVVDLLTLCVEAGLDFMSAIEKIILKDDLIRKRDPLIEELNMMINEIRIGLPRSEALKNFAKRVGITEVKAFVSVLLQTEELGTDLVMIMRDYAEEMRTKRLQTAEKKAAQIGTKMLFPMIIFIFPMTFVIILVPLIIKYLTGAM